MNNEPQHIYGDEKADPGFGNESGMVREQGKAMVFDFGVNGNGERDLRTIDVATETGSEVGSVLDGRGDWKRGSLGFAR